MRGMLKPKGSTLEDFKAALEGKLYVWKNIKKIVCFRESRTGPVQKTRKQELSQGCIRLCLRLILENTQNHSDTDSFLRKGARWLNYEAQMETDVFLYPPWFAALGGGILRDATGAVRLSMDSGEPRQQDDVLSDFGHDDCLCNRKCILWQGIA